MNEGIEISDPLIITLVSRYDHELHSDSILLTFGRTSKCYSTVPALSPLWTIYLFHHPSVSPNPQRLAPPSRSFFFASNLRFAIPPIIFHGALGRKSPGLSGREECLRIRVCRLGPPAFLHSDGLPYLGHELFRALIHLPCMYHHLYIVPAPVISSTCNQFLCGHLGASFSHAQLGASGSYPLEFSCQLACFSLLTIQSEPAHVLSPLHRLLWCLELATCILTCNPSSLSYLYSSHVHFPVGLLVNHNTPDRIYTLEKTHRVLPSSLSRSMG